MQYTLIFFGEEGSSDYREVSSDVEDPRLWAMMAAGDHYADHGPVDGGFRVLDAEGKIVAEVKIAEFGDLIGGIEKEFLRCVSRMVTNGKTEEEARDEIFQYLQAKAEAENPVKALASGIGRRLQTVLEQHGLSDAEATKLDNELRPYVMKKIHEAVALGTRKVVFETIDPREDVNDTPN